MKSGEQAAALLIVAQDIVILEEFSQSVDRYSLKYSCDDDVEKEKVCKMWGHNYHCFFPSVGNCIIKCANTDFVFFCSIDMAPNWFSPHITTQMTARTSPGPIDIL